MRHEILVFVQQLFVRQILQSSKFHIHHALPAGKNFATGQGQGDGFLLGFFCDGFAGDGRMDLLAQFDRFENRALVLLLKRDRRQRKRGD
jgi:hypothetical protein